MYTIKTKRFFNIRHQGCLLKVYVVGNLKTFSFYSVLSINI